MVVLLWLQMVKMMVYVVVIYALCWLPLHTITLIGDTNSTIWSFKYIQVTWIGAHWLAMSNCCCNPIVYYWMSSNFRNGYRTALTACCPPCAAIRGGAPSSISHGRRIYYTPPPIRGQAVLSRGPTVDTTTTLAPSESQRSAHSHNLWSTTRVITNLFSIGRSIILGAYLTRVQRSKTLSDGMVIALNPEPNHKHLSTTRWLIKVTPWKIPIQTHALNLLTN